MLQQKRQALNTLLDLSGKNPVKSSLKKTWENTSDRHKRRCIKHAQDGISSVLEVIAPEQESSSAIWDIMKTTDLYDASSHSDESMSSEERELIAALAECYENANGFATRRQILSIMADKYPFKTLQQHIPGLTRYAFTMARRHILIQGRGVPIEKETIGRVRFEEGQLEHFLEFITSPHIVQDLPFGEKMLKLSTGEVIYTPNVIRVMIPERIITQYISLCEETGFSPLSHSSLKRVLKACAASVRTSLQGLDYFTAEGNNRVFIIDKNLFDSKY